MGGEAGSAGDAGDGGSADARPNADTSSVGEVSGEGGTSGTTNAESVGVAGSEASVGGSDETIASCGASYSACDGGCIPTDDDPENCGGCNLRCPAGSVCKAGMCEVRIGYPNRFTANDENAFRPSANIIHAVPIELAKRSTLLALGFLNASTTAGTVATFGLYNDSGMQSPGTLVASATGVSLQGPVQEITTSNVTLVPGTYYFTILPRDDNEPTIYTSPDASPTINIWYSGASSYHNGLPPSFGGIGSEAFAGHLVNVYLVVRQPGN